jgi:hypothetical protein
LLRFASLRTALSVSLAAKTFGSDRCGGHGGRDFHGAQCAAWNVNVEEWAAANVEAVTSAIE